MSEPFRSGLVAIIGRPSVGKSTLVNRLVGTKVSVASPRPQTTRHRILGIYTRGNAQIVYVDTPGMTLPGRTRMTRYLNRTATGSVEGVDVIMLLITADGWREEDEYPLSIARRQSRPVILAINKVDRLKDKSLLLPLTEQAMQKLPFAEIVPVSALKGDNVEALERVLLKYLPEQPPFYPPEQVTDKDPRFLAAELIREQIFHLYGQEVPYATAVKIEEFKREDRRIRIAATIWVEREGQKAILVGKGGARLKTVGRRARLVMQELFDAKVRLELWVKVRENWSDNEQALQALGYVEGEG
jgi:GTP-binding protein Era